MWDSIVSWLSPPSFSGDPERTDTARLLNAFLLIALGAVLAYGVGTTVLGDGLVTGVLVGLAAFSVLACVALVLLRQGYVRPVGLFVVLLMWSLCTYLVVSYGGIHDEVVPGYFLAVAAAGLILGNKGVLGVSLLSGLALAAAYYLESVGRLDPSDLLPSDSRDLVVILVLLGLMYFFVRYAVRRLQAMTALAQRNAVALEEANEAIVAGHDALAVERDRLLARLQSALSVTRAATAAVQDVAGTPHRFAGTHHRSVDEQRVVDGQGRFTSPGRSTSPGRQTSAEQRLLAQVAGAIAEEFGFDRVAIFWVDRTAGVLVGQRVSGSVSRNASAQSHAQAQSMQCRMGEGIVGLVAADGQARLIPDVAGTHHRSAGTHHPTPMSDLPDTRSELVVPIVTRGEVVGVLDVCSNQPQAFGDEDRIVLQALVGQLSLAVDNAQFLRQLQTDLQAAEQAYRDITRADWQQLLRHEHGLGYISTELATRPVGTTGPVDITRPVANAQSDGAGAGRRVADLSPRADEGEEQSSVRIPVELAGQVVAEVEAHLPPEAGQWTEDRLTMLETLSSQLSQAMERARLYRETQRRATRERVLREIADEMGRASDLPSLMRITVDALNRSLGGSHLYVRLASQDAGTQHRSAGTQHRSAGTQHRSAGNPDLEGNGDAGAHDQEGRLRSPGGPVHTIGDDDV